MQTVNQSYLKSLIKHAKKIGFEGSISLEKVSGGRISLREQGNIWKRLSEHAEPSLGFEFGKQLEAVDLGIFGHLLMSAATLGEALRYLQKYYPLVGDGGVITVEMTSSICAIVYQPIYSEARSLRVEAVMACLIRLGKKLTSSAFPIVRIDFDFEPHEEVVTQFNELAGSNVCINQHQNRVIIPISSINSELEHADPALVESLLPNMTEQLNQLNNTSTLQRVTHFLELSPKLTRHQLATKMALSERSLCRHLKDAGTTFALLKRRVCQNQAEQMVSAGKVPIESIAEAIGYSDSSAFIKAFKNWTGKTPRQFRKEIS